MELLLRFQPTDDGVIKIAYFHQIFDKRYLPGLALSAVLHYREIPGSDQGGRQSKEFRHGFLVKWSAKLL